MSHTIVLAEALDEYEFYRPRCRCGTSLDYVNDSQFCAACSDLFAAGLPLPTAPIKGHCACGATLGAQSKTGRCRKCGQRASLLANPRVLPAKWCLDCGATIGGQGAKRCRRCAARAREARR